MAAKFDVDCFVKEQLKLIQLERTAEIEESLDSKRIENIRDLEKRGICIPKLSLGGQCTGLYGKHLVTLVQNRPTNKSSKVKHGEESTQASSGERVAANCFSNGMPTCLVLTIQSTQVSFAEYMAVLNKIPGVQDLYLLFRTLVLSYFWPIVTPIVLLKNWGVQMPYSAGCYRPIVKNG